MTELEKAIQTRILMLLQALGAWEVKTVAVNRNGTPDILACLRGRFIAIEVKRKGKKPDPLQAVQLRKIREAGGIAFSADSEADIIKELDIHFNIKE